MNEKDREVMQQALEALEIGWSTTHTGKDARELGMKAITALTAALAQQAEPVAVSVDELAQHIRFVDGNHSLGAGALAEKIVEFLIERGIGKEQAEPVQPVGEILPNWSTEKECIDGICAYLNDLGKNLPVGTKLHTHPPQRTMVPLTSDKDRQDQGSTFIDGYGYVDTRAVRAIEQAFWRENK